MTKNIKATRTMKNWDETTTHEVPDGPKITRSLVTYEYSGDIVGESKLDYTMTYLTATKTLILGFEQIQGKINGLSGSFVLRHEGTFDNGVAKIEVSAVPNSGTENLKDTTGKGLIESDSNDPMKSYLVLDVDVG